MSVPVADPPALERNPEEEQCSRWDLGHILAQLSAALESPDIKVVEVQGDAALGLQWAHALFPEPCVRTGGPNACHELGREGTEKAPFCRGWMSLSQIHSLETKGMMLLPSLSHQSVNGPK